jgi:hypothetical protein
LFFFLIYAKFIVLNDKAFKGFNVNFSPFCLNKEKPLPLNDIHIDSLFSLSDLQELGYSMVFFFFF